MQNALSASAGRAFFHGRGGLPVAPAGRVAAIDCNLGVILFSYVVDTGQLSRNLMQIVNFEFLVALNPCEIKQNCEICGTIGELSRKNSPFISYREKLFTDVKSALEHSRHAFPF
jgi:hypothetical protein